MTTINTHVAGLRYALKAQTAQIEKRVAVPVLGCVRIEPQGISHLSVTGTDLDSELALTITGTGDGVILLPLDGALKVLDGEDAGAAVKISTAAGRVTLQIGRDEYRLDTFPPEDFPVMAFDPKLGRGALTMEAGHLRDALTITASCVSTEATRYYLNGVLFTEEDGKLAMVATDGHRMAHVRLPYAVTLPGSNREAIVPSKAVGLALRSLKGEGARASVSVTLTQTKARFAGEGWTLTTKLIDGTFPDYTRVMPRDVPTVLTANPEDFTPALKKLIRLSSRPSALIAITPGVSLIESVGETVAAKMTVDMEAEPHGIERFGVNAAYLRDILALIPCPFTISGRSAGDPFLIEPTDTFDVPFKFVQMPVKVQQPPAPGTDRSPGLPAIQ